MLYRYRAITKYSLDEINNQYIYCSKISEQDDVFEARSLSHYLTNTSRDNDRICCFSNTFDNEAMWALYSNKCNGICIAIDLYEVLKCSYDVKKYFIYLFICRYVDKSKMSCNITIDESPLYKNVSWFWQNEARLVIPYAENFDGKIFIPFIKIYIGLKVKTYMKKRIVKICKNNNIHCFIQFDQLVSFNYVDAAKFEDEEFVLNILRLSQIGE